MERVNNGKKAGDDLIKKLKSGKIECDKQILNGKMIIKDTVDVVAHSMGFAYSLGMIESLQKAGITIGNYYVIAPENACSGWVPPNISKTWQYGSNEDLKVTPLVRQDGVAPQCPILNIDQNNRVFIPKEIKQDFLESHSIKNYEWIFSNKITKMDKGYVYPRN